LGQDQIFTVRIIEQGGTETRLGTGSARLPGRLSEARCVSKLEERTGEVPWNQ